MSFSKMQSSWDVIIIGGGQPGCGLPEPLRCEVDEFSY